MPWLQLKINAPRDMVSAIETSLTTNGCLSVTFQDNADDPIFEPELGETPLWQDTRITGLYDASVDTESIEKRILNQLNQPDLLLQWQILEDKDWEREWMSHYQPIQCHEQFWICPSWITPPDPNAINLMLDPGLAFGTGTHPTTFLCLSWLAAQDIKNKTVIDYGCGSGILGIGALLKGAHEVIGIDIDPQALLATRQNTTRNQMDRERFPVFFPNKCPATEADITMANILAGPLVELASELAKLTKSGGKICLSGVLADQKSAVVSAYEQDFLIDEINQKDDWICIIGTKRYK